MTKFPSSKEARRGAGRSLMVWVCHHVATGDVTIHASGPKPRCKDDTLRGTLYNGEEATEVVKSNGEVRSLWYEAVIND